MIFQHNVKAKEFPMDQFEKDMRKLSFVKDLEIIPFTSRPIVDKGIYLYFMLRAKLSALLPSVFETKLTVKTFEGKEKLSREEAYFVSQCTQEKLRNKKPLILVAMLKYNQSNTDFDAYSREMVLNLSPSTGSRTFTMGKTEDSDDWDSINVVRFESRKKLCELILSEEYAKVYPFKQRGLDDTNTYITNIVLTYQKDLL